MYKCAHPNPRLYWLHCLPSSLCRLWCRVRSAMAPKPWSYPPGLFYANNVFLFLGKLSGCMCSFHNFPSLWSPIFHPCITSPPPESTPPEIPNPIRSLLATQTDVFQNPHGLHPPRSHDHHISLATTEPVNVRPYRYSHHQRSEIESQISSMLSDRIIQPAKAHMPHLSSLSRNMMALGIFVLIIRAFNSLRIKDH